MIQLPKFKPYGESDVRVEQAIQPTLALRKWTDLQMREKTIAIRQLEKDGWLGDYSGEILQTGEYLNHNYLRQCPFKRLHKIQSENPRYSYGYSDNESKERSAAGEDYYEILLHSTSEDLVLRMISKQAEFYIDGMYYTWAKEAKGLKKRKENLTQAFDQFDRLSHCFNHIFEQFSVNQVFTRNGLVPRQDERITEQIYKPTLQVLSDPKWKNVNDDLSKMFIDYRERKYPETITKAHKAIQRFLQVLVGEEGKSSKGEVGKLFKKAKVSGDIPSNLFTDSIIDTFQAFIVSERATNSTAKPTLKNATSSDAILVMNVVLVFLQHCLQKKGSSVRYF